MSLSEDGIVRKEQQRQEEERTKEERQRVFQEAFKTAFSQFFPKE